MKPIFSVVIPCYNEEPNLIQLFKKVLDLLNAYPSGEVILVNNGSKDNSLHLLDTFKTENNTKNISICNVVENKGYGFGILAGLKLANSDILSWTHADLQTDLLDVGKAFELFQAKLGQNNDYFLVKGYRVNRKFAETALSYGMATIASIQLRSWMQEINAQPKMFSRVFYENVKKDAPWDFSLDLYWMYSAKKMGTIATFPVQFIPRTAGEAKGGSGSSLKTKWKIIKRTFKYINQLTAKN